MKSAVMNVDVGNANNGNNVGNANNVYGLSGDGDK